MITNKGTAYFLNRLVNNDVSPINSIVLGTGGKTPSKTDTALNNQTLSKNCLFKIDIRNRRIILTANLTPSELEGVKEIGAMADGELLTHDLVMNAPSNITSNINLEYIIELETTNVESTWILLSGNIYYCYQPDKVKGVIEANSDNGYHKAASTSDMTNGSYYYDQSKEILYIQTIDGTTPNNKSIQVITK